MKTMGTFTVFPVEENMRDLCLFGHPEPYTSQPKSEYSFLDDTDATGVDFDKVKNLKSVIMKNLYTISAVNYVEILDDDTVAEKIFKHLKEMLENETYGINSHLTIRLVFIYGTWRLSIERNIK